MEFKRYKLVFWVFVLFAVIYAFLTLTRAPDAQALTRYGLSDSGARILSMSVVFPYIAIWFLALYGYTKFKTYSQKIISAKDGKAMSKIADGLLALALWMPVSAAFSSIGSNLRRSNPGLTQEITIFNNYTSLLLVLVAFIIIHQGASKLPHILQETKISMDSKINLLPGVFLVFCASYAFVTLSNPANQYPIGSVAQAVYYLPEWLLLITIILPYMAVWYLGFSSVLHLRAYLLNVRGPVYKKSLSYLATGILIAVLSIITLRILTVLTLWFDRQKLWLVLVIVYLLLALIGAGYFLIAKGAKQLQRIEEV